MKSFLYVLLIYTACNHVCVPGELADMKIVEEPSSFGLNSGMSHTSQQQEESLKLRIHPANFSGPPHFKRLLGRCFTSVISDYKYKFCPFSNITQHEQGIHWNPYNGVLGVWQEWEVSNNTFVAMVMKDGDSCGRVYRSIKVTFMCGNHSQIVNVSEPRTCSYHLVFMTPLVCHPDSMLVYPTLSADLQGQWDKLEGEMARGELTEKGYTRRLDKILEKAGIYLSSDLLAQLVKDADDKDQVKEGQLDTLDKCQEEVKQLKERIANLTSQLEVLKDSGTHVAGDVHETLHFEHYE